MSRSPSRLPLLLLLASPAALPNGGPVAWSPPTGMGDGSPQVSARVRLVREDLHLKIGADPDVYEVEARYVLSNPGAPVRVRYGVPLTWADEQAEDEKEAALQRAARGVSIELGGARGGCEVGPVLEEPQPFPVPGLHASESPPIVAWCLTELTIPTGEAVPLTLRYRAATRFTDRETSTSPTTRFDTRDLIYPLFPAAGWAGRPDLNVRLDLGSWAETTTILHPAGARRVGDVYSWSLPKTDLRELAAIVAQVDVDAVFGHRQLVATNRQQEAYSMTLSARASSVLAGGGYEVDGLLDGLAETAWCEGVEGDGVGEWVELSVARPPREAYCQVHGLVIVPGYARSQAVWEDNNRVASVSVGPCGGEAELVALSPSRRHDASATLIELAAAPSGLRLSLAQSLITNPSQACVRVTLQSVEAGARHQDTCLSELAALINCG